MHEELHGQRKWMKEWRQVGRNLRKSGKRLEFGCLTKGAPLSSKATTESVSLESASVIESSNPSPEQ